MSDENATEIEEPTPTRTKVIAGIVASILLAGALYAVMRVSSPAIRPDQVSPAGHYQAQCGACHPFSDSAPVMDVTR